MAALYSSIQRSTMISNNCGAKILSGLRYLTFTVNHGSTWETAKKFSISCSWYAPSSSQQWINRHVHDPYVKLAKKNNYRARSAFKLIEIDDRFHLLTPGSVVIDCGAAPGAWSQVAVDRTNATAKDKNKPVGKVIGVDLLPIQEMPGLTILSNMSMTTKECHDKIASLLNDSGADVVLSDMCQNVSGFGGLDHDNSVQLVRASMMLVLRLLKDNGAFLVKLLDGEKRPMIKENLLKYFETVKFVKPVASRSESSEVYILARNFKKPKPE